MKARQVNITDKTFVADEKGEVWTPFKADQWCVITCRMCGQKFKEGWLNIDSCELICNDHLEIERNDDYVVLVRHIASYPAWVPASSPEEAKRIVKEGAYIQLEETTIEDNCEEAWAIWTGDQIPETYQRQIRAVREGHIEVGTGLEDFDRVERIDGGD